MIRVENIGKRIDGKDILKNVTFEVNPKSVLGIIGPSGSGKTTLLRCLNGLERITGGIIKCNDVLLDSAFNESEYKRQVKMLRRQVGTVFQHLYLFPHLTVIGNIIEAPVHVLGLSHKEAEAKAIELLKAVGLSEAANRLPESLSGGEQQRVAIARALAMQPDVLLFDEPTSALDPRRTASLKKILRGFVERGHTMVAISHSINFLEGFSDYLLYMENGEAVEFNKTHEILNNPIDPRTQNFLQDMLERKPDQAAN